MLDKITPTPKTFENISELCNKAYDDGLKEPIKETSSLVAIIPRSVRAALAPVEQWILYKDYSVEVTKKLLDEKLSETEPDKIVPPDPYVAVPALNAIAYCYNSDELRNLYANLRARSMVSTEKENVHPAFVEIIKQMSPLDAKIIKTIYETPFDRNPLLHIKWANQEKNIYNILQKNVSWIEEYEYETTSMSIENLLRQKLIEIPSGEKYSDDSVYDIILNSSKFKTLLDGFKMPEDHPGEFEFTKTLILPTAFGKAFYNVCIRDL